MIARMITAMRTKVRKVITYRLRISIITGAVSATPIPIPIVQINAKLMCIISYAPSYNPLKVS
jgi:hypothetical protein